MSTGGLEGVGDAGEFLERELFSPDIRVDAYLFEKFRQAGLIEFYLLARKQGN